MIFKPGETVKIKTPISQSWFLAHVLEVSGDSVKAKTIEAVRGSNVWIVSKKNVKALFNRNHSMMKNGIVTKGKK